VQASHGDDDDDLIPFEVRRPRYLADLRGAAVEARFELNFTDAKVVAPGPAAGGSNVSGVRKELFPYNGDDSGTCLFNGVYTALSRLYSCMSLPKD
jgi:hypothetical protein